MIPVCYRGLALSGEHTSPGAEDARDVVADLADARPARDAVAAGNLRESVAARMFGTEPARVEIGRYVVLERTGAGAMGVVYAAYDPTLDRKVALKLVAPGRQRSADELVAEARTIAAVSHPNVVAVHDVGTTGRSTTSARPVAATPAASHRTRARSATPTSMHHRRARSRRRPKASPRRSSGSGGARTARSRVVRSPSSPI